MELALAVGADIAALVRAAPAAASLVVVVASGRDALSLAVTRAAIGPLAVERAPASRINAVLPEAGADPADVAAAVAWLEGAASTTGQVLAISEPPASARTAPATR